MDEVWKDIEGYEGLYQVSNTGQVKSLNYKGHGVVKLLKQSTNTHGYKQVQLYKNSKTKHYSVHRLVALAFISNPDDLPMVNHKDEDKTNNNVNNLEWCTIAYNNNYGTKNERVGKKIRELMIGKKGKDASGSKPILMYDKEGNFIRKFDCIGDANEYFGKDRNHSAINQCLKGRAKTAYGYVFIYVDDNEDVLRKKINEANETKKKSILMYDKEGNFIRKFDSTADVNEYLGKGRYCSAISMCLTGRRKTAYGYVFKYAEEKK